MSSFAADQISFNPKRILQRMESADQNFAKRKNGPHMLWMKEYEKDDTLVFPKWNLDNGIPTFARALNDYESGIACIVGQPNAGKSTVIVSLELGALEMNDDTIVVDLSLDDPFEKRYAQWLANLSGLRYSEVYTPSALEPAQMMLLDAAKEKLKDWIVNRRLFPFGPAEKSRVPIDKIIGFKEDGSKIIQKDFEVKKFNTRHYQTMLNLMKRFRDENPDKKIVFMVDAWNNLDYTSAHGSSDLTQMNFMLDKIQEVSDEEKIKCFVSAHARKTLSKKVTLEDIKGTKNMEYNCVWGAVVRNEYRENIYTEPLTYTEGEREYPILTIEIGKTKVSSWDMPMFYALMSDSCRLKALTKYEYEAMLQMYSGNRKMKAGA